MGRSPNPNDRQRSDQKTRIPIEDKRNRGRPPTRWGDDTKRKQLDKQRSRHVEEIVGGLC